MATKRKRDDDRFDFSQYPTRHICIKIAYHGQTHDGLAKQENTVNTIETLLIDAMKRTRLINPNIQAEEEKHTLMERHRNIADASERYISHLTANGHNFTTDKETVFTSMLLEPENFSRCARTDKGVSALGNAFSCKLRAAKEGEPQLDYCKVLNGALPNTIRVIAWGFVDGGFDARFSCTRRTYRYYFNMASLNISKMREAAKLLEGSHDFRNFCKMDVVNVSSFIREVWSTRIVPCWTTYPVNMDGNPHTIEECAGACQIPSITMGFFEITGNAFLYHQIRCIMTILILVGKGLEDQSVVEKLLDVSDPDKGKPCYPLADDSPLVLWDCEFHCGGKKPHGHKSEKNNTVEERKNEVLKWNFSQEANDTFTRECNDLMVALAIRAAVSNDMNKQVESWVASGRFNSVHPVQTKPLDTAVPLTGVDWTNPRAPVGATKRQVMNSSWEIASIGGSVYRPISARPVEKTFKDRVDTLSQKKRQRREENMRKGS